MYPHHHSVYYAWQTIRWNFGCNRKWRKIQLKSEHSLRPHIHQAVESVIFWNQILFGFVLQSSSVGFALHTHTHTPPAPMPFARRISVWCYSLINYCVCLLGFRLIKKKVIDFLPVDQMEFQMHNSWPMIRPTEREQRKKISIKAQKGEMACARVPVRSIGKYLLIWQRLAR